MHNDSYAEVTLLPFSGFQKWPQKRQKENTFNYSNALRKL